MYFLFSITVPCALKHKNENSEDPVSLFVVYKIRKYLFIYLFMFKTMLNVPYH